MPTANQVRLYRKKHDVGLNQAVKALTRREFSQELRTDRTVDDLADTLIRILTYEFGRSYED